MTFSAWNCAMTIPLSDTLQVTVTKNTNVCTDLAGAELTKLSPDIVFQGLPAQFNVDLSPDDATKPYTYTLGYGDLTPPLTDLSSADPFQFSYTYQQTGTFTMTFSAWNCAMTIPVSDTLQVEVEPFIPPMKVFLPMIMTNFAAHTQAPVKTLPVALWAVIPVVGLSIRKFYKRKK
jgi:hypothetical protein